MCDKCRDLSERIRGLWKKPRKGSKPKYKRVNLMKTNSKLARKKKHVPEIIARKGCVCEKNIDLELIRNYDIKNLSRERLVNKYFVTPKYSPLLSLRMEMLVPPKKH